jgi:16S rRNA processing protein RimM
LSQVEIGRVVKPHGIRGEVGVLLHQPQSDLLEHLTGATVELPDGAAQLLRLERVAKMGQGYRVKFEGVDDRNAAERLRDARLSIPRDALPPLDDDEAYLVDLIGASVLGPDSAPFGVVIDVLTYPSVDAVVIERPDNTQVEQPLVEEWVEITNDGERPQVRLKSLEGLL